jgi:hypothetical protein
MQRPDLDHSKFCWKSTSCLVLKRVVCILYQAIDFHSVFLPYCNGGYHPSQRLRFIGCPSCPKQSRLIFPPPLPHLYRSSPTNHLPQLTSRPTGRPSHPTGRPLSPVPPLTGLFGPHKKISTTKRKRISQTNLTRHHCRFNLDT